MKELDFIMIFTGSSITVQRVVFGLKNANIIPVIKDETESARLAGFGVTGPGLQHIFIHKDQIEKALVIVKNITLELETQD